MRPSRRLPPPPSPVGGLWGTSVWQADCEGGLAGLVGLVIWLVAGLVLCDPCCSVRPGHRWPVAES